IPAISQTSDLSFSSRLHSTKWGSIETQPESSSTNIAGVFACGDAVVGPSTVIDSIAAGKNAALEIHSVLSGELLPKNNRPANEPRHYKDPDFVGESRRVVADAVAAHERVKSFCEVEHVLSEEDAVAESMRCLSCGGCSECMQCVEACKAGAIEHNRADDVVDLNVGAIVLAPGFKEFDASRKFDFGYSRSQNIVSSMEFERMLSSSGPYSGHIMRPSDKQPIHKLAFIQCVGSRDKKCGNEYCSSVCCMYAVKEAVIAKEHDAKVESAIYYMDMRAHGKDFDKYVERAKNEYGVLFKRSRVYSVEEESSSGSIVVSYESENGVFTQDRFDLCVLSVGLEPNDDLAKLAERLGIECNSYGFLRTDNLRPIDTTADGIYVCGVGSGPKDIPETVLQASAASARAGMLLGNSVRGTLTKKKIYPPETDVSYIGPRIGVFVCHCGINIGGIVNVPSVVEYARTLRNVTYVEDNVYTCSQDTQDRIRNLIHEHKLNRVVVASCSPRTHESLFQETVREAGLNPHLFEMANIRDQCSWVHMNDKDAATSKAKDLVRMAVAKVRGAKPLTPIMLDVNHRALVLGGGLAGMTAALAIAEQGFEVDLVEKTSTLGGNLAKLTRDSDGQDLQAFLRDLIARVRGNGRIKVRTKSFIKHVAGFLGNYETVVETRVGKKTVTDKIAHGVAVIAIGGNESVPSEYGYGRNKNILTQLELEQKFKSSRFRPPKTVVMIQCVGSREPEHMYCSKVCCVQALRNALRIKALRPDTEVFILYRDIRAYGFHELEYKRAREAGTLFARFDIDSKPTVRRVGRQLKVTVNDKLLGDELVISADLLVLSSRIDPNTDATELASMFKIPLMEDGFFLEAHAKLRPVDFATEGIYVCGLAHYPKNASESIAQALAAAGRAVTILAKDQIEAEGKISYVIEDRCSGCGACVEVCAYNAIELDPVRRVAVVNQGLCKGCGACAATCRTAAIDLRGFRDAQMLNVIDNI
ncbi:MAG: FAD-dependent oxidoreductase, partial [Lentisphaerae bacterium]|nr:FAD-dependent oxidoreductase [Lentisphaerota bacterium]